MKPDIEILQHVEAIHQILKNHHELSDEEKIKIGTFLMDMVQSFRELTKEEEEALNILGE